MYTDEGEKAEAIREIGRKLVAIGELDPRQSVPTAAWPGLDYEEPLRHAEEAICMAKNLLELPLNRLHDEVVSKLPSHLELMCDNLNKMSTLDELQKMDNAEREKFYGRIKASTETLAYYVGPNIGALMLRSDSLWQLVNETKMSVETIRSSRARTRDLATDAKRIYDDIVKVAQKASSAAAIGLHANKFKEQASKLREESKVWLWSATGAGALSFVAALSAYIILPEVMAETENIRQYARFAGGTAIVAIFLSAAVWCGRMYRALIHQATVYEHRQLALESFLLFINGSASDETKDAVLVAAAHAAYGNVPTGLVDQSQREVPVTGPLSQLFSSK